MDRVGGGRNNFVTGATTHHQTADSSSWQLDDDRDHEILEAGSDISSSNPDDQYMYMAAAGEDFIMRRGPWTLEEDLLLVDYITKHGEGRWNSLAQSSGLKRTGKSCRLRWLNYLRPDVRRGNITPQEQLLILQLHSRWGNRWSKIAQYLPGRTDNEIKNYWRTRVQKQAKQLRCDVNSKLFKDTMRYIWMPRLAERIQAAQASSVDAVAADDNQQAGVLFKNREGVNSSSSSPAANSSCYTPESTSNSTITTTDHTTKTTNTVAAAPASSDSFGSSTSTSTAPREYYMNNYPALDHYDHGHDQSINTQNTQFMISSSPSSAAAAAAAGNYLVNSNMPYNNNIGHPAAELGSVDHHLQNHYTSNNTTPDDWLVDEDSWDINLWNPELLEDSISWFNSSLHQQF